MDYYCEDCNTELTTKIEIEDGVCNTCHEKECQEFEQIKEDFEKECEEFEQLKKDIEQKMRELAELQKKYRQQTGKDYVMPLYL